jgi:hypothetical protein
MGAGGMLSAAPTAAIRDLWPAQHCDDAHGAGQTPTNALRQLLGGWGDLGQQVMTNLPWTMVTRSAVSSGGSGGPLFNAQGGTSG